MYSKMAFIATKYQQHIVAYNSNSSKHAYLRVITHTLCSVAAFNGGVVIGCYADSIVRDLSGQYYWYGSRNTLTSCSLYCYDQVRPNALFAARTTNTFKTN
jgi:hypothetical protein